MIKVEAEDPRLVLYKTMRDGKGEDGQLFIGDGEKVALRILDSSIKIRSIYSLEKYVERYKDLIEQNGPSPENIFVSSRKEMEQTLGYAIHQGMMVLAEKPESIPAEQLKSPIIVLNNLISSENTGSVIRNCAAFGVQSLLADNFSCHPYIRRSVRVSMGHVLDMQVSITENLVETLNSLKTRGFTVIGTSIGEDTISLYDYKFPENYALVIGNEGAGMSPEILEVCDVKLRIPMKMGVDSLNAAAASAVFLSWAQGRKNQP